jgi:hypothetical protein
MSRLRGRTLAGVLGVLGCLLAVLAVLQFVHRSSPARQPVAAQPAHFDYGIVFTPKPLPTDAHYLTADEAWMRWAHGHHLTRDISAEFGVLNYEDVDPAWGFTYHGCMQPHGWPSARQVALAQSPKCREWTFLNASTGRQILTTDVYPRHP